MSNSQKTISVIQSMLILAVIIIFSDKTDSLEKIANANTIQIKATKAYLHIIADDVNSNDIFQPRSITE